MVELPTFTSRGYAADDIKNGMMKKMPAQADA